MNIIIQILAQCLIHHDREYTELSHKIQVKDSSHQILSILWIYIHMFCFCIFLRFCNFFGVFEFSCDFFVFCIFSCNSFLYFMSFMIFFVIFSTISCYFFWYFYQFSIFFVIFLILWLYSPIIKNYISGYGYFSLIDLH